MERRLPAILKLEFELVYYENKNNIANLINKCHVNVEAVSSAAPGVTKN